MFGFFSSSTQESENKELDRLYSELGDLREDLEDKKAKVEDCKSGVRHQEWLVKNIQSKIDDWERERDREQDEQRIKRLEVLIKREKDNLREANRMLSYRKDDLREAKREFKRIINELDRVERKIRDLGGSVSGSVSFW